MKKIAVFDIEVLPNVFICCVKPSGEEIITFEISARRNDLNDLLSFFSSGEHVFVGYNCSHYDTPIINMLFKHAYEFNKYHNHLTITENAKRLSDKIIKEDTTSWISYRNSNYFKQIDLMTMMASQALRVGLKSLQVSMCYPNVEEMIIDWDSWMRVENIDTLISYCHNDVNSTATLLGLFKNDLQLRKDILKEFGIECYSKDGVAIGVQLFTNFMVEDLSLPHEDVLKTLRKNVDVIHVKDLILPQIKLKTKPFQKALDHFKNLVLNRSGLAENSSITVLSDNLGHTLGLGGIHSLNEPAIYKAGFEGDQKYVILDIDVEGMYPAMVISHDIGPLGFKESFIKRLAKVRSQRVEAKRNGDKVKDKVYKLLLNSLLGRECLI